MIPWVVRACLASGTRPSARIDRPAQRPSRSGARRKLGPVTSRARIASFGGAFLAIIAGAVVGALAGGVAGEAVAISLGSLGVIAIVSLVFLEVGLSEDRERAREDAARGRPPAKPSRQPRLSRPRRPG